MDQKIEGSGSFSLAKILLADALPAEAFFPDEAPSETPPPEEDSRQGR